MIRFNILTKSPLGPLYMGRVYCDDGKLVEYKDVEAEIKALRERVETLTQERDGLIAFTQSESFKRGK